MNICEDDFQYYRNHRSNSWVSEGALHVMPTLTALEYGEDFLYSGCIDLNQEVSSTTSLIHNPIIIWLLKGCTLPTI